MLLFLFLCGCGGPANRFEHGGQVMGTTYTVKIARLPPGIDETALAGQIQATLDAVDRRMSTYKPDSELSLLNANRDTAWIDVSPELLEVLRISAETSVLSDGAFDVTVGPLVNLWNFGPEVHPDRVPSQNEIAQARERVGYHLLELRADPPAVRKQRGDLYVDLSAVAKGYAVDRVADRLEALGIENYLVEVGGELRVRGSSPKGRPWQVAVEKPVAATRTVQRVLPVSGGAVATSGDYRNFFEIEGRRYSHEIDPKTGWPVQHPLVSATVLHESCAHADALATAMMVLGPERAMEIATQQNLAVLLIVRNGDTFVERASPEFQRRFPL